MKLELGFLKTIFYHLSNPWSSVLALGLFCRDCHNQGLVITITDLLYLCLDFKWVLSVLTFSSLCSFEKSRIPRSIGELERRIFWIFEKFSFKMTLLSVIRREEEDRFKHRCVSALAVLSLHSAGRCQLLKGRNKVVVYKRRSGYTLLAVDVQIDWGSTLQICQHNKGMLCAVTWWGAALVCSLPLIRADVKHTPAGRCAGVMARAGE